MQVFYIFVYLAAFFQKSNKYPKTPEKLGPFVQKLGFSQTQTERSPILFFKNFWFKLCLFDLDMNGLNFKLSQLYALRKNTERMQGKKKYIVNAFFYTTSIELSYCIVTEFGVYETKFQLKNENCY